MSVAAWLPWEHLVSHVRSNPLTTESRSSNRTDDSREGESFDVKETASEAKSAAQERVVAGADAGVGKAADGFGAAAAPTLLPFRSTAPMSTVPPTTRVRPRWSVASPAGLAPAFTSGLPVSG